MLPHFGLCFEGRLARELRDAGCTPTMLGEARVSRPWTVAAARAQLRGLLDRQRFDAAICHSCWPHGLFAPVIRSRGIPLVYWSHDVPTGKGWLERWARRTKPDLVLANSRFTALTIERLFERVRCEVQYPPVECASVGSGPDRASLRSEWGAADDEVVILLLSRMQRSKGHHLLLRAGAQLIGTSGWRLVIAGAPTGSAEVKYLRELQDAQHQLALNGRVSWIGQRDDVRRVMLAADVLCQPNIEPDAFGVVFIEALSAGLPVLTTRMGGAVEIFADGPGLLVEPSAASIAAGLRTLIGSKARRDRHAAAGPPRAQTLCDPAHILPALHARIAGVARRSNSS